MRRHDLVGTGARWPAPPSRAPGRPARAIASRSPSLSAWTWSSRASSISVPSKRLPWLSRGDPRMVREEDRGAEQRVVVGADEHGPGVDVLAAVSVERRDEAAAGSAEHACVETSERVSASAPGEPVGHLGEVSHQEPDPRGVARLELQCRRTPQPVGLRTTALPAPPGGRRSVAPCRSPVGCRKNTPPRAQRPTRQQTLDLEVVERRPARGSVRGRIDDPERRRRRVLGRSRRVGVRA